MVKMLSSASPARCPALESRGGGSKLAIGSGGAVSKAGANATARGLLKLAIQVVGWKRAVRRSALEAKQRGTSVAYLGRLTAGARSLWNRAAARNGTGRPEPVRPGGCG